jgi:hypothetical protein
VKLGRHALEAHDAENESKLAQNFQRQPVAAAQCAGNLKGLSLVASPALNRGNRRVEVSAMEPHGPRAEARA